MIVSINQPAYLPWLGYFDRIAASDLHVVLDMVQFEKNSFVNRNRVRSAAGTTWLTVPVRTAGRYGDLPIDRLEIANTTPWARKHWQTIAQCYAKAPWFAAHGETLEAIYNEAYVRLDPLMQRLTESLLSAFEITTPLVRASTLQTTGRKDDLVLAICRKFGATVYLSGPLGRNYLDESKFAAAGIAVRYHDYRHPTYPQLHEPFMPNMSAIDALLLVGGSAAGRMLRTTSRIDIMSGAEA